MRLLTLSLLMTFSIASLHAAEIPGYVGSQSFQLSDQTNASELNELKKINSEGAQAGKADGRMDAADLDLGSPYPGDFNGPNFKPKINHEKIIMVEAFADGYIYNYRKFARLEFLSRLDNHK